MAENEILDVANGRRWIAVRRLLSAPVSEVDAVLSEFEKRYESAVLRAVRGAPLEEILRAAADSQAALRFAISQCKHKEMARLARDAISVARSTDPNRVAAELVSLMRDRLCEKVHLFAVSNSVYNEGMGSLLEQRLRERLSLSSPNLVQQITSALRGGPVVIRRPRIAASSLPMSSTSILEPRLRNPHGPKPH